MKNFIKQNKHVINLLFITLIIAIISGLAAFGQQLGATTPSQLYKIDDESIDYSIQTEDISDNSINITTELINLPQPSQESSTKNNENNTEVYTSLYKEGTEEYFTEDKELESEEPKEVNIETVTLKINNQEYNTNLGESNTVYEVMEKLAQESNFSFSGKEYSSLGFFVDEINGVKNNNKTGEYWIYYVNGVSAKVGISNYLLNNNDLIEWKYESSNF